MLSEQRYAYEDRERPWTVPALIAFSILGWIVSMAFDFSYERGDSEGVGYTLVGLLFLVIFARGLWLGLRWAYAFTVFFGVVSLFFTVPYLLSDDVVLADAVWLMFSSLLHLFLLFHPLTRAYFKEHPKLETADAEKLTI